MSVEKDLRYVYGWNYYTMRLIGIWPQERKWNQPSSYLVAIPVLMMFFFVTAPQTANIPNVYGNMYMLVENLSMANITITISMLKTIAFWVNGKPLRSLLKCMARDWSNDAMPNDRETMMNVARISRKLIVTSTLTVSIVVFAYAVRYYMTAKYTDRKLFFHATFPYDVDVSPNLQLTVCGQLLAAMYAASSYTAVDTFIAMLVLHICGQLTILKRDITNLRENGPEKLRVVLGKIVRRHQYINTSVYSEAFALLFRSPLLEEENSRKLGAQAFQDIRLVFRNGIFLGSLKILSVVFENLSERTYTMNRGSVEGTESEGDRVETTASRSIQKGNGFSAQRFAATIEDCFNVMLLLQMLGCTLQLCFQCLQAIMTLNGEEESLVYAQNSFLTMYVLYIMAQLYLYCYVGDKLTSESKEVAKAAYDCAWYDLSSGNAKLLLIIMCRDRLPLRITAGRFCSFTLQLYSEILKRSMGYVSVLYTMQKE